MAQHDGICGRSNGENQELRAGLRAGKNQPDHQWHQPSSGSEHLHIEKIGINGLRNFMLAARLRKFPKLGNLLWRLLWRLWKLRARIVWRPDVETTLSCG